MIPSYFIKLKEFKQLTPNKARIQIEGDDPLLVRISKTTIDGVKCYKVIWNGESFICLNIKDVYYMFEEYLKIKVGEIYENNA